MSQFENIFAHVPYILLVIFRLGGITIYGPIFGSSTIPARVKIFLVFALGIAIYPPIATEALTANPIELSLWGLLPLISLELMIGLIIGYVASLPLVAAQTSGLIMGQQMGLGFARFYNPAIDDEADVLGQIFFFMVLAGFLYVGGHEAMLLAVMHSFERIPLGGFAPDLSLITLLSGLLLATFELALRTAAPLLALIFLESAAMGFVAKTVPQLNILSLGFPLRILIGLGIVMVGLVAIREVMIEGVDTFLTVVFEWIDAR